MRAGEGAAIILLVLSSFAATTVAPTKSELEAMYAAAAQELNAGHYRAALDKLDAIDERQPELAAAQNLRGVALMRLGEYRNAETALHKARAIDPGFWEARFNLAEVPFLAKNWALARSRFSDLIAQPNEHVEKATLDLIQFKILLTCLLENKEKVGAAVLEKLQSSPESPALYYAKAAFALRKKDRREAQEWMATAAKEYSPQLNRLFTESFYEIGWLPKPKDAPPVALEVSTQAERVARAQAVLARAERAFRQGDLEGASKLLDEVDAIAPNQAVAYNLRGEVLLQRGQIDEAETALRNALAGDPQLLSARYNLARVPFARKNFDAARKELEALLGAFSGAGDERREQLIRYQIYLTLLLGGHEGAAQKALDEFKMMDGSPALYYAQAAWAFQHGNPKQGKNWVANAGNLFPAELNRSFAAPFADLGWLNNAVASVASPTPEPIVVKNESLPADVLARPNFRVTLTTEEAVGQISPTPAEPKKEVAEATPAPKPQATQVPKPEATQPPKPEATPAPKPQVPQVPKPEATQPPKPEATPAPKPEATPSPDTSPSPTEVAKAERETESDERARPEKKRATRKRTRAAKTESSDRSAASPPIAPPPAMPTPLPVHENVGDKVRNFFLYPFKRPLLTPTPGPVQAAAPPSAKASPTPFPKRRRNN